MTLTSEQLKELEDLSKPLIKFLCENYHPHVKIIIDPTSLTLVEEKCYFKIKEFVLD